MFLACGEQNLTPQATVLYPSSYSEKSIGVGEKPEGLERVAMNLGSKKKLSMNTLWVYKGNSNVLWQDKIVSGKKKKYLNTTLAIISAPLPRYRPSFLTA